MSTYEQTPRKMHTPSLPSEMSIYGEKVGSGQWQRIPIRDRNRARTPNRSYQGSGVSGAAVI